MLNGEKILYGVLVIWICLIIYTLFNFGLFIYYLREYLKNRNGELLKSADEYVDKLEKYKMYSVEKQNAIYAIISARIELYKYGIGSSGAIAVWLGSGVVFNGINSYLSSDYWFVWLIPITIFFSVLSYIIKTAWTELVYYKLLKTYRKD